MSYIDRSQIVICGREYMEIDGCRRIMEYNDIYLKVKNTCGVILEVWGTGLRISDFGTGGIAVTGQISSVELH